MQVALFMQESALSEELVPQLMKGPGCRGGTLLWRVAGGCVIIRGIQWLSFTAAAPAQWRERGQHGGPAANCCSDSSALSWKEEKISAQDTDRLFCSRVKTVPLNTNMLLVELCHDQTNVLRCVRKSRPVMCSVYLCFRIEFEIMARYLAIKVHVSFNIKLLVRYTFMFLF